MSKPSLRVAIEGCGHGTLHAIYASIDKTCEINGWDGIDLLLIGGDFQAVRNSYDLNAMSVPMKFRELGDFHEYYSGIRKAPYLTVFVGGNHEASNHLFELYYGGWVAPNIYYMGAASIIRCGPLRIAGLSGIWKGYNYKKTHHERLPYNQDDVKSIYHVREADVRKLMQVRTQVDIGMSHDWPRGIEWLGNWKSLFSMKNHFEADARDGTLGSVAARMILDRLRPPHWFSAHLHCKFSAIVEHGQGSTPTSVAAPYLGQPSAPAVQTPAANTDEINIGLNDDAEEDSEAQQLPESKANGDEIDVDIDDLDISPQKESSKLPPTPSSTVAKSLRDQLPDSFRAVSQPAPLAALPFPVAISNKTTKFLALDKCLPNRKFLQIMTIEATNESSQIPFTRPVKLSYDKEWLAITRSFASQLKVGDPAARIPHDEGEAVYMPMIESEQSWVEEYLVANNLMEIPENFEVTAPVFESTIGINEREQPREYTNNQTMAFCDLLKIPNPFHISEEERQARMERGPAPEAPRRDRRGGGRDFGRGGGRGRARGGGRGGRGHRGGGRGRGR